MGYAFTHRRAPAYDHMLTFSHGGALGLGTGNFHFGSPSRLAEIKTTSMLLGLEEYSARKNCRKISQSKPHAVCLDPAYLVSHIRLLSSVSITLCAEPEKPETAARQPKFGPDTASSAGFLVTAFPDLSSGRLRSKPRTPKFHIEAHSA